MKLTTIIRHSFSAFSIMTSLVAVVEGVAIEEAVADQFIYDAICNPTQFEDVARTVQGNIYLALRADKTVRKSNISVRIRKDPSPVYVIPESVLLGNTGYQFNAGDLSISMGGDVSGHACFVDARLFVDLSVIRKDGTSQKNNVVIPIKVAGAYATKGKKIGAP